MRNIITKIFIILSVSLFSQTKLDTLVFNNINKYRDSLCLPNLTWDTISFKAAKHHSNYTLQKNTFNKNHLIRVLGHSEDVLKSPSDRYDYYGGKNWTYVGENLAIVNPVYKNDDNLKLQKIADLLLKEWIKSPNHNKILLSKGNFGGVCCLVRTYESGFVDRKLYEVFSTFISVKK